MWVQRLLLALLALVITVFPFGSAAAGDRSGALETLQAEYPRSGPGAYAIIARSGRVVFSGGFGRSDLEHDLPLTAESVVRAIASLTKHHRGCGASLGAAAAGKARGSPGSFASELSPRLESHNYSPACGPDCRRLIDDLSPLYARSMTDMTVDELLALYRDRPLETDPGAKWRYSNLNYWILGKVIEAASGKPYADYVAQYVLAPGMTHTRYGSHAAIIPGRASGYERDPTGGWVNALATSAPHLATRPWADSGSTAVDMALLYAAPFLR